MWKNSEREKSYRRQRSLIDSSRACKLATLTLTRACPISDGDGVCVCVCWCVCVRIIYKRNSRGLSVLHLLRATTPRDRRHRPQQSASTTATVIATAAARRSRAVAILPFLYLDPLAWPSTPPLPLLQQTAGHQGNGHDGERYYTAAAARWQRSHARSLARQRIRAVSPK